MNDARKLLEVEQGLWGYQISSGPLTPACPVSFSVSEKEIVLLSGDNGSGKTTILRGILDMVESMGGQVHWSIDRREVGYVPQESVLDRSVPATALDVVRTGSPNNWRSGKTDALAALAKVGLEQRSDVSYGSLSGGQRQRVLVARALLDDPKLLILDEPTVNVDAETAQRIGQLLEEIRQQGPGMIITSHIRNWVTATRVVDVRAQDKGVPCV